MIWNPKKGEIRILDVKRTSQYVGDVESKLEYLNKKCPLSEQVLYQYTNMEFIYDPVKSLRNWTKGSMWVPDKPT